MPAQIIDGKKISEDIKSEVRESTKKYIAAHGYPPGLAFILIGEHPASQAYVKSKGKACDELGFYSITERMPVDAPEESVLKKIAEFNRNPKIHGILVQLPLPKHINEQKVIEAIDPKKDVDGFHPFNVGQLVIGEDILRPCTPAGIQELLVRSGNDPSGKHVVIVGRSNIVGKPLANILVQKRPGANAVVTIAHTGAKDLPRFTRDADILIAAIGRPRAITGEMVKKEVVVIDVGINRIEDLSAEKGYRLVGDVDFDSVVKVARAITPVPGGVGPMTIAMLMQNTLKAAERQ
jgi:methylenetetrahydrofolate dehydrogenase (NADP+)/methenyltetrahydrofolate cyclohydrolase